MQKILYFFSTKSMFPKEVETIPNNKEAYSSYLKMAWPCVLEALLLCMVNVIDTMMVGSLGETAIAAVGITSQPRFLLLAIVFSLNVGITAVVARRKGENNREAANSILKGMLILSVILGIIIAFIGITFSKQLMNLAGAQEDYLQDAIMYFQIIAFGLFFQTINLMINAAQRGSGKTRITMVTNMVSNIVNITFNYLLINGKCGFPKLGVQGAAIATSLGCIVACTIAISTLFYKNGYLNVYLAWKQKITAHTFHSVVVVGSSAFVEQIFLRIGFMLYAIIVAKLGTTAYATHLICMTLLNMSFSFGDGISIAASALVGQNLGAKKIDLAKMYAQIGQRVAFLASTMLFFVFLLGRNTWISFFSTESEIIAMGANILIIMAFTTHIQTAQLVYNGCLRGAGDSRFVAIVALISVALVRPIITYVLCFVVEWGLYGAWISLLIDQLFRFLSAMKRFYGGKWSQIKL